jgi:hypothetical protein
LRRFQGVGAGVAITPFSGNLSYPSSLSPQNSPHCAAPSRLRVLSDQPSGLTLILRTSSGVLNLPAEASAQAGFFLQPLFGGIKGKLVDTLHDLSQTGR